MNLTKIFVTTDRIAAWVLLLVIIAYGITGYGMTKGLIPSEIASDWHLGWLGIIGLLAFVIHTSWAIHLFFIRHNIWNLFTKIILISFYIILTGFFIWVHFFFTPPATTENPTTDSMINTNNTTTIFTAETLLKYNGKNGQPAYVAVDGIVYDMSQEFPNGRHYGYSAGTDLSAAFHAKHPDNFLNGLPVVGTYKN